MTDLDRPPFPGFSAEGLAFLRALRAHNDRAWFKARKATFDDELDAPFALLVADVADRLARAGLPLTGDPSTSRFRIYRDTRFSDDKRPYKTHLGAVFNRAGTKDDDGLVYVHVEPGASFLAAGVYRPSATFLRPIREAMARDPEGFYALLRRMDERGLPVDPGDHTLTGMPRGFADYRDAPIASHLRWTALLVRRDVPDDLLASPAFAEAVVTMTRDSLPLLRYIWSAREG
jgi:uncharacterized protein (TIGR02453 family)